MPEICGRPYPSGNFLPENRFVLYPGGNFMPEIRFILSPGGVNLVRDSGQVLPQWGMTCLGGNGG